jgi:hypothetical protein
MTWETSSSIPITTAKAHSSLSEVNIRPGTGSHRTIRQRSPRKCLQFESLFCILHTNIKSSGSTDYATSNPKANEEVYQAWINFIYSPVKPLDLGVEYINGKRDTFAGDSYKDNRVGLMAKYSF